VEDYLAIKKKETNVFRKMDGSGDHCVKTK
jgi:hypothetical protein